MREVFREGQQPEIPRNTEGELPEEKIFDLLSSVGNAENKALELIAMREGVIYPSNDLDREMKNRQGENPVWRMGRGLPFAHCNQSLSPIGLVTKEAIYPDGTVWGYQITEYGLRTGVPFAGALLKWSYEHPEHSLYKMFGSTQSSSIKDQQTYDKKRAQEIRYKIFWEIATAPSNNRIRLMDLVNAINEHPVVIARSHLDSLNRNRIVSYEATEQGKTFSYFRKKEIVPSQVPEQYQTAKTLSTRVYDLVTSEYLSVEEVLNQLIQQFPEYNDLEGNLRRRVASILTHFEKQGYLERKKFGNSFQSELTISDDQREAIVSLLSIVDKFKNGDREIIEEGKRFAQRVANDPNLFSELILKAKEISPQANRTNKEDMEGWLISILHEHPSSTTKQIQQTLERDYNKRVTVKPIRKSLSMLIAEEKVVAEKTKSGNVYNVVDSDSQFL